VQLKKLKTADLIAAKMKALMTDMKNQAAIAVSMHGIKGATAGNMTPMRRFKDDSNVLPSTRYEVPEEIIHAKYEASEADADAMDAWDREVARVNETLKKEGVPSTSKGGANPEVTIDASNHGACSYRCARISGIRLVSAGCYGLPPHLGFSVKHAPK
jgi:hypothetical protein